MTSEIRTNSITSRAGLSTVTLTDSGPMFSGITTFVDNSTFSVGTGGTIHAPATNTLNIGVNNTESLRIDSNSNLKIAGVCTATHFYGNGSNLTGISAGTALSGSTNNTIVTVTGANAIQGEANLTFDGNNLNQTIDNSGEGIRITASGNHYSLLKFDSNASSAGGSLCNIQGHWNGTEVANIIFAAGDDTSNKDDGYIRFLTTPSGGSSSERLRITSEGYLYIRDNGVTQTNTTLSYSSEGGFITHYTARTTAGGDRYRRMLDIASVGANPHGSSIRFLTSADSTNPATTIERVRIDHNGRVGINKTTPQTMLSIKAERSAVPRFGIDGIYSDSSYTQSTWDDTSGLYTVLGVNHKLDANGNDGTLVSNLHSASIMLDGRSGNIRFFTKEDGGQTAPSERLRIKEIEIDTANEVGINVNGGNANHTNDAVLFAGKTNNADWCIKAQSVGNDYGLISVCGSGAAYSLAAYDGSNFRFRVRGDGVIFASNTTIQSISDVRLKENIVDANSQWDDIKALRFRNFNWKSDSGLGDGKTYLGLIAQEVEPISPNLIDYDAQTKEDIENGVPDPEHKSVKYSIVWMKAVKALQEAQDRIEQLEAKVTALETKLNNHEKHLQP